MIALAAFSLGIMLGICFGVIGAAMALGKCQERPEETPEEREVRELERIYNCPNIPAVMRRNHE